MDKKNIKHQKLLSFLKDYLNNTDKEVIQNEIQAISQKQFAGTKATDYFENYHLHYAGDYQNKFLENDIPAIPAPILYKVGKLNIEIISENLNDYVDNILSTNFQRQKYV